MTTLLPTLCQTMASYEDTLFFRTKNWSSQRPVHVARDVYGSGPRAMLA